MEPINTNNKFHLSYENEYYFWENNVIGKWIIIDLESQKCPSCKNTSLRFVKIKKSLSNPVILKCNKKHVEKKLI